MERMKEKTQRKRETLCVLQKERKKKPLRKKNKNKNGIKHTKSKQRNGKTNIIESKENIK